MATTLNIGQNSHRQPQIELVMVPRNARGRQIGRRKYKKSFGPYRGVDICHFFESNGGKVEYGETEEPEKPETD